MDEEPSLLLEDCYYVTEEGELGEYPLHSTQRDLFLTSETVMSILDPSAAIAEKYGEATASE